MAILAGKWAALRRSALPTLLAASLFLMACGATGGANSADPAPAFMSAPGTAATQDSAYAYQITTSPASATLALTGAPTGAALSGNMVTWTPSAAQSRVANQFEVTATSSAGSTTQSWSVTPTGTVRGSFVETYWNESGQVQTPLLWLPDFPFALIPLPNGSFQALPGFGNADGTFSIPNVPSGYYWLEATPREFYWTGASTIDLGVDFSGSPGASTPSITDTGVNLNFAGLDPLQSGDQVIFLGNGPTLIAPSPQPIGSTTLSIDAQVYSNLDFSQPRTGFMLQYEPETVGALNVLGLGPELTLPNLALTSGTSNTVNGTLTPLPPSAFDLSIRGSAWPSLFVNVSPGQPTLEGADLEAVAVPFVTGNTLPQQNVGLGAGIPLMLDVPTGQLGGFLGAPAYALTGTLMATPPVCGGSGPIISTSSAELPGEAAFATDQDFGPVRYSDPFPSTWTRALTLCETAWVTLPAPNSATPITFQLVDQQSASLPSAQIAPPIGPVQNPMIDGMSLFTAASVSASNITLSWTAPAGTAPTGYKITVFTAQQHPNGIWTYSGGAAFDTTKTSAVLPSFQPGATLIFEITSILDGAANFETKPNRSALPTASVSVISAPITAQ